MANVELKPARVFEQFAKINAIPRPSKHEEKMIEYLKAFGQERGEKMASSTRLCLSRRPPMSSDHFRVFHSFWR